MIVQIQKMSETNVSDELHVDKEFILILLSDLIKGEEDVASKEGEKISINEQNEKQKIEKLCTLWDLSASKDVARYLPFS